MTSETKPKTIPQVPTIASNALLQKCIEVAKSGTKSVLKRKIWYSLKHIVDKKIMTVTFNEESKGLTVTFNHKRALIAHDKTVEVYRKDLGWEHIIDELYAKLPKSQATHKPVTG